VSYITGTDKNDMVGIFFVTGQAGAEWRRFPFNFEQEFV
jgi:hypothetical protein